MYKTKYFKNINLSSLASNLTSLSSAVSYLLKENNDVEDMFNSTEWEGQSKNVLKSAFKDVDNRLNSLKTKIEKYVSAVDTAKSITTLQDSMSNETNVDSLLTNASSIQDKLTIFKNLILGMSNMTTSESYASLLSSISSSDGFGSGVFSVNPTKYTVARDSFLDWSDTVRTNYDSFLSLKSLISSDDYLYYGWGLLCYDFDELVKKRDSLENWIENFIINIDSVENGLPETVKSISNNSTNSYAKTHNYPSSPNYNSYVKNGRTSEIKENTSSSSSSSGGSSGGYSGKKYSTTPTTPKTTTPTVKPLSYETNNYYKTSNKK